MAHPKHNAVRRRYGGRCGYCGISEIDSGGELTVDHYCPVSAGGDDSEDNLVYCCPRCNQYKAAFVPTPDEAAQGLHILHPLQDDLDAHLALNHQTGILEARTEVGRLHIRVLRLNRPALIDSRIRQRDRALREVEYHIREEQVRRSLEYNQELEKFIVELGELLRRALDRH